MYIKNNSMLLMNLNSEQFQVYFVNILNINLHAEKRAMPNQI